MWIIIEEFLIAFIMLVFVTQIMMPVLMNKPIFPILRWRKVIRERARQKEALELEEYLNSMVELDKGEEKK